MLNGKGRRAKGHRAEREVIAMLQPIVDNVCAESGVERFWLRRNLFATHTGGCDLHGLDWLSLEVKRQEKANVREWWRQTLRQCQPGQTPVLVYRASHQPWTVRMRVPVKTGRSTLLATATVDMQTFLVYFEERLKHELSGGGV